MPTMLSSRWATNRSITSMRTATFSSVSSTRRRVLRTSESPASGLRPSSAFSRTPALGSCDSTLSRASRTSVDPDWLRSRSTDSTRTAGLSSRAAASRRRWMLPSFMLPLTGRTAYEGIAGSMATATDHPFADILNAGRKVVFSRTLKTADWANTTIAAGDTAEEIDKLRLGGDGHIVVWDGVSLWRSLMRLDLIDELQLSLFPYVAGEGTRLFDASPSPSRPAWASSPAASTGIVELQSRRPR